MKRLLKIVVGFLVVLALAFLFVRSPDTDFSKMRDKYGGDLAHFSGMPSKIPGGELNVHYRDQGDPNGEPIIFIHGSNASLHTWENVISEMPPNYRLISLDLPGHGLTGAHPSLDYSISGFFDALDSVIAELELAEQKLTLVGNSMGGWVSWRYALEHPERVKSLVLIDAAGAPSKQKPPLNLGFRMMRNPLIRPLTQQITPRWIIRKSLEQTVYDPKIVSEDLVDQYWELLRFPGNRKATSLRATTSRETDLFGNRLNEIQTPTLILWGEEDQLIFVSSAHIFDRELNNSELITYPNIGHLPMEENPLEVARDITSFLETLGPI